MPSEPNSVSEHSAGREVERTGDRPSGNDRRQQQQHRSAEQKDQIDSTGPQRFRVGFVRDQRVRGKRQRLVKKKECEQVLGKGDAHGAAQGDSEADVECGLAGLVVSAHIANGVNGIEDP